MAEGKEMKVLRERAGLTQQALADMIGTHVMTVSKWEQEGKEHRGSAAARALLHAVAFIAKRGLLEEFRGYMAARK